MPTQLPDNQATTPGDPLQQEGQFRSLIENAPIGVYRTTPDGHIAYANAALVRMLSYGSFAELSKRNLEEDGFEPGYDRQEFRRRLEREGEIRGLEAVWKRGDGSQLFVREHARAVRDARGQVVCYEGTVEDITERKRTEQKMRERTLLLHALIDNSPLAIVVVDAGHSVQMCNRAFTMLFGYRQSELLGAHLDELLAPPELLAEAQAASRRALAGEKISLTTRRRRKDGSPVDVEVHGVDLTVDGQRTGGIGIYQDISARKQLETQLSHMQKMEAVGRLAGGVAHDFNNLLMIISGYAEILTERLPDPALRGNAEEIRRAAEQATALTRQLLTFSRRQPLQPKPLDLNTQLHEMQPFLRRLIPENIEVLYRLAPGIGQVQADPAQLEQVVMNLTVNAVDAMPTGGRLVFETSGILLDRAYAQTHPEVQPGPYVLLSVTDTGAGMEELTKAHLFEPFFTTKHKGKGTGLGLATVYGFVRQSGGHITVESEPGRGASFKIYLPQAEDAAEQPSGGAVDTSLPAGRETVLLVEDEEGVRTLTREVLTRQGYSVLAARNGAEALEIAAQHAGPIHLLLTDVIMPGISGNELAERLVQLRPETRVMFVSGYPGQAVLQQGALRPGTVLLKKPFQLHELARKVREVLDQKS